VRIRADVPLIPDFGFLRGYHSTVPDLARAIELLKQGRLVAFPTETVYGLGADATNAAAIDRIYETKGRPSTNPLIVHVASEEIARRYVGNWPAVASRLARQFWPGPLTIVLSKRGAVIPDAATAGLATVAVRVPDHPLALELLRAFDGPLAAPSANRSNRVSPTTASHVLEEFPDSAAAGGAADREPALVLDGGACTVGIESTVLDLTTPTPTVLRPGHVTVAQMEEVVGGPVAVAGGHLARETPAASPGLQAIHYAPRTIAYRFETSQRPLVPGHDIGLVALSPLVGHKEWGRIVAMSADPVEYAQHFYDVLRRLDAMGLPALYIEFPPDQPEWSAIRDRITRATRPYRGT